MNNLACVIVPTLVQSTDADAVHDHTPIFGMVNGCSICEPEAGKGAGVKVLKESTWPIHPAGGAVVYKGVIGRPIRTVPFVHVAAPRLIFPVLTEFVPRLSAPLACVSPIVMFPPDVPLMIGTFVMLLLFILSALLAVPFHVFTELAHMGVAKP